GLSCIGHSWIHLPTMKSQRFYLTGWLRPWCPSSAKPSTRSFWEIRSNFGTVLKVDLPLREPGELDVGRGNGLLSGKVDGCLPVLIGKVAVDFEVLADALDGLKVYLVQRCSTGDEVLGHLLIAHAHLEPFIAAQVIGNPALAALALAADPVAEELAL